MKAIEDLIREEAAKVGLQGGTNHCCHLVRPAGMGTNSGCDCAASVEGDRIGLRHLINRVGKIFRSLARQVIDLRSQLHQDSVPVEERRRAVVMFRKDRRKYIYDGAVVLDTLDDARTLVWAVNTVSTHRAYMIPEDSARLDADISLEERKKAARKGYTPQ